MKNRIKSPEKIKKQKAQEFEEHLDQIIENSQSIPVSSDKFQSTKDYANPKSLMPKDEENI